MDEKIYCVYRHVFPNGKIYVGVTSQRPKSRWKNGKHYAYNSIVGRAIDKYGWENVIHEILFLGLSGIEAKSKEQELIKEYQTQDISRGYNLTAGGDGMVGFKTREETKAKLSAINTGKHHTEESRKKMSASHKGELAYWYGKKFTDKMRESISIGKKGKHTGEESYWYGKTFPAEMKLKMSLNHADVSGSNNPRAKQVVQCDPFGTVLRVHSTVMEAAESRACNRCTIQRYCSGKFKDKSGYVWRYAEEGTNFD